MRMSMSNSLCPVKGVTPALLRENLVLVGEDLLLFLEDAVLVFLNGFLVGKERRLVGERLVELRLVSQDALLVRENRGLVGEDFVLIDEHFIGRHDTVPFMMEEEVVHVFLSRLRRPGVSPLFPYTKP